MSCQAGEVVERVAPMQAEEIVYKLEPYFHDMSQSLSYLCMATGISTPEIGIKGQEFIIFQGEVHKLLLNFRNIQAVVKEAVAEK